MRRTTGAFCGRGRGADMGAGAGAAVAAARIWVQVWTQMREWAQAQMREWVQAQVRAMVRPWPRVQAQVRATLGEDAFCAGAGKAGCGNAIEGSPPFRHASLSGFRRERLPSGAKPISVLGIAWLARYTGRNALLAGKGWWGAGVFSLHFCR